MASALKAINNFIKVKDETDGRPVDRWKSPDILPVLPKNRRFDTADYASYWVSGAICASFWAMGGTAIANGLTAGEAIGAIMIGTAVCAIIAHAAGDAGLRYQLGFPMMSRATFGMYGSYFAVVIKCFTNFLYCGIQSYWGGLAVSVMLSSIFPTFHNMKNTLPESANITTPNLIGTIIYVVIFWGVLCIQPYKLNTFFRISFCCVVVTILGTFIWAMSANHGAGPMVAPGKKLSHAETFFVMIQTVCTLCGSFTGASVRQSDWSRYSKTPRAPFLGIYLVGPLALTVTAMFGVFVTAATIQLYGDAYWQPISLLLHIQDVDYSAGARAGTFFGGLGWFLSQLAVNVSLNSVSAGMDLTSVAPKYLNARRGSLMVGLIGLAVCPWNYVNSASTFTIVLSSFGMFISPLLGLYVADYWVIRRRNWNVPHLYIGSKESIYWYTGGFNLLAFTVWIFMIWPSLPGFIMAINGNSFGIAWQRIFQITFFVGLLGSFTLYSTFATIWPPRGGTVRQDYDWSNDRANDRAIEGLETKDNVHDKSFVVQTGVSDKTDT